MNFPLIRNWCGTGFVCCVLVFLVTEQILFCKMASGFVLGILLTLIWEKS